jgi:hypothetical protein
LKVIVAGFRVAGIPDNRHLPGKCARRWRSPR